MGWLKDMIEKKEEDLRKKMPLVKPSPRRLFFDKIILGAIFFVFVGVIVCFCFKIDAISILKMLL